MERDEYEMAMQRIGRKTNLILAPKVVVYPSEQRKDRPKAGMMERRPLGAITAKAGKILVGSRRVKEESPLCLRRKLLLHR